MSVTDKELINRLHAENQRLEERIRGLEKTVACKCRKCDRPILFTRRNLCGGCDPITERAKTAEARVAEFVEVARDLIRDYELDPYLRPAGDNIDALRLLVGDGERDNVTECKVGEHASTYPTPILTAEEASVHWHAQCRCGHNRMNHNQPYVRRCLGGDAECACEGFVLSIEGGR